MKKNILWDLFVTFAKIGRFTIGGGYAMISVIENNVVKAKGWITHDEMMNLTVIAASTPGPIAVNCATYVGYRQAGLTGAIVATIGFIVPAFFLILFIAAYFSNFMEYEIVANAFKGIKIAVGVLILDGGLTVVKQQKKTPLYKALILMGLGCMLVINFLSLSFSSISLMIAGGVISLSVYTVKDLIKKEAEQ